MTLSILCETLSRMFLFNARSSLLKFRESISFWAKSLYVLTPHQTVNFKTSWIKNKEQRKYDFGELFRKIPHP